MQDKHGFATDYVLRTFLGVTPFILPPTYLYAWSQLRDQGQVETHNQLLAPEGLRIAARDICHRRRQAGGRQKVSALPRRLEFRAGCRPGRGIGAFQRSMTMAETHHISHSGGRLRAPRECQNLPAVGQGGSYVLCPTLVRSG